MSATEAQFTTEQALEYAIANHPGVFAERRMGHVNAAVHWEWYELQLRYGRLAVIAPREHGKTEIYSVVTTAHQVGFRPGIWQYVFSATMDQARFIMERISAAVAMVWPDLLDHARKITTTDLIFANGSRVTVASTGKAVRGVHPDRIVGDDVMEEDATRTAHQREQVSRWWFGTVGPMAHPGTWRQLPHGAKRWMPATKIMLVGTPYHQMDLLMGMRENPLYVFRRYSAEFNEGDLLPGSMAVEAA